MTVCLYLSACSSIGRKTIKLTKNISRYIEFYAKDKWLHHKKNEL